MANTLLAEATKNMENMASQDGYISGTVRIGQSYEDWTNSLAGRMGLSEEAVNARVEAWGGESRFQEVQDKKVTDRVDTLTKTDRFTNANEDADIGVLFGTEHKSVLDQLNRSKQDNLENLRETRTSATATALRSVDDATLMDMTAGDLDKLVADMLRSNQIFDASPEEIQALVAPLLARRAAKQAQFARQTQKDLVNDILSSADIKTLLSTAQGTNIDDGLLLTQINLLATKYGKTFGSVEEFEAFVQDESFFENYAYRSMSVQYAEADKNTTTTASSEAEAASASGASLITGIVDDRAERADKLQDENETVPAHLSAFQKGGAARDAIANIVAKYIVKPGLGPRIVQHIETLVQEMGLDATRQVIESSVIMEFGDELETKAQYTTRRASELLAQQGFTIRPGEDVGVYGTEALQSAEALMQGLMDALQNAGSNMYFRDQSTNTTVWFGEGQAVIAEFKNDINAMIDAINADFNSPQAQLFGNWEGVVDINGQQVAGKDVGQVVIDQLRRMLTRIDEVAPTLEPTGRTTTSQAIQPSNGLPAGSPLFTTHQTSNAALEIEQWEQLTRNYTEPQSIIVYFRRFPDAMNIATEVVRNTDLNGGPKALRNAIVKNSGSGSRGRGLEPSDTMTSQEKAFWEQMWRLIESGYFEP